MHALREACQVGARGVELVDERGDGDGCLALAAGGERRKVARHVGETLLGSAAQLLAQPAALLVACLDEPAARCRDLAHARRNVGLKPHVGQGQPHGGGNRARQRLVAQRGGVVHERGHRRAAVLHERDDSCLAVRGGQSHRLPGLVDPLLAHPVGDLESGIADRPGQRVPQGLRLLAARRDPRRARWPRRAPERPETRSAARAPAVSAIAAS